MTELVTLSVDIADHVATVTLLERAMGPTFWDEIPSVFDGLSANPDVRAVVVHNVGQHFTYGLDLMRMMSVLGPLMTPNQMAAGRTDLRELVFRLQESFNAVARCRKPVIAALHGWCIASAAAAIACLQGSRRFSACRPRPPPTTSVSPLNGSLRPRCAPLRRPCWCRLLL